MDPTCPKSQQFLDLLLQHLPNIIVALDRNGTISYINRTEPQFQVVEVIGTKAIDYVPPEQQALFRSCFEQTFSLAEVRSCRIQSITGVWYQCSFVPVVEQEEVEKLIVIASDISDFTRSEAENRALHEQVKNLEKLESLGLLAGGVAHDFSNILMSVLGNAGLALKEVTTLTHPTLYQRISHIEQAALRGAELTNQMLSFAGRGVFLFEDVNMVEVLRSNMGFFRELVGGNVDLLLEAPVEPLIVHGDRTQLLQVGMNLVKNAYEAYHENARAPVVIRLRRLKVTEEFLGRLFSGGGLYFGEKLLLGAHIVLEVVDRGQGMSNDTLARIFDPFFTTKKDGRGFGLASVLGIVRSHKGAVRVVSEPGEGTSIEVFFPERPRLFQADRVPKVFHDEENNGIEAPEVVSYQCQTEESWQGRTEQRRTEQERTLQGTALVIDDDEAVCSVIALALEEYGYCVYASTDADSGLALFREHLSEIDVVLLDATMPSMSGEEVFNALRKLSSKVRVILCSGYADRDFSDPRLKQKLAGFLAKPFGPSVLIEKISEVFHAETLPTLEPSSLRPFLKSGS